VKKARVRVLGYWSGFEDNTSSVSAKLNFELLCVGHEGVRYILVEMLVILMCE